MSMERAVRLGVDVGNQDEGAAETPVHSATYLVVVVVGSTLFGVIA